MIAVLARREAYDRGREAEAFVARDLVAAGWTVLARNWHAEGGELDLVVERAGVLRFVEVKARVGDEVDGLEAIGRSKQRRLRAAAEAWLAENGLPEREVAFLVALVGFEGPRFTVGYWDDAF